MSKIMAKAVTRLQRLLAAIAGDAVAPTPITNQERLLYNIAEEMKNAATRELPAVTPADDGKVLTARNSAWGAENPIVPTFEFRFVLEDSDVLTPQIYLTEELVTAINNGYSFYYRITADDDTTLFYGEAVMVSSVAGGYAFRAFLDNEYRYFFASTEYDEQAAAFVDDPFGRFIVTLTPTAEDFSGTMDHTVAEIDASYKAGRQVVFRMMTSETTFIDVPVQLVGTDTTLAYPSYETNVTYADNNVQIFAMTAATDDGTKATYSTVIYALTPAT